MPSHTASLAHLLDMGIPRGRALAALKRSKDDAMSAAERVFAGEFDDIPSDDEGDDGRENANGLLTPSESLVAEEAPEPACMISAGVKDVILSDDAPSDFYEDEDMEAEFDDFIDDEADQPMMKDPYANVFFSKDRVEHLVEPVNENLTAEVCLPPGYASLGKAGSKTLIVKVIGRGEWMSGCPEGGEQSFLFQSYNSLAEGTMPCVGGCGHEFPRAPQHFFALFPTFPAYAAHLASIIQKSCPKCKHVTCFACGETSKDTSSVGKGKGKGKGGASKSATGEDEIIDSLFHCPAIQGVILGVGLQMMEEAFNPEVDDKATDDKTASGDPSPPSRKRKHNPTTSEEGLGAISRRLTGKSAAKGTGYSGEATEDRSGQLKAEATQAKKDAATAALLSQVSLYLPNVKRSKTFTSDYMMHPTALAHLRRRSAFVNDLLQNDSLLDMTQRDTIYRALLDWLEIVANHEALAAMLAMPQMRPMGAEPGPQEGSVTVRYEGRPSPRELLESIVIQATSALKGLSATTVTDAGDSKGENQSANLTTEQLLANARSAAEDSNGGVLADLISLDEVEREQSAALRVFCERILSARDNIDRHLANSRGQAFVDRMHAELPSISSGKASGSAIVQAGEDEAATIKIYEDWAQRVRFQHCDMIDPADPTKRNYRHAYNLSIVGLAGTDAPKRSLAIAKELGVLSTNIPTAWDSSIFLRVDEDRVDCIKAMIIGPKDTPYENGCFVFDIFLPLDYNQRSPSVKFMTTNGGKYRYNPNLYADGKVCLSLLGTWAGPGWIAGKSTLLQVLISIQSLILCEEPYLNEPGWATQGGSAASKAYSANIRRMVLHDAMANNIKSPPYPFEDEIKTHFRLKANAIRAQLDRWKPLDNGMPNVGSGVGYVAVEPTPTGASGSQVAFDKYADEVRRLLDELEPRFEAVPMATPPKAAPKAKASGSTLRRNPPRKKASKK